MGRIRNRGLTGFDSLIMVIAIIVVTAMVAIFLMTTNRTLEQRLLAKGAEGRKSVTAGFEGVSVIGMDASSAGTPHFVDDLRIMVRLLPGVTSISLNTTLIVITNNGVEELYTYNVTCQTECTASSTNQYVMYYLQRGLIAGDDYVNIGDVVKLALRPAHPIGEADEVTIRVAPAHGPATELKFVTPQSMTLEQVALWP
ncbi:MAG: hypothetical protein V1744_05920 [Candidatus Altiarchaeota archaeon]